MKKLVTPLSKAIAFALLMTSTASFADGTAENTQLKLRLMETTDIHMNLVNYNYFTGKVSEKIGLSKAATLIKAARAEVTNSLLVDNGDLLQGSPMGDYMARTGLKDGQVHPAYKAMNPLGYVVGNIGNHEFNYGLDFLKKSLAGSEFPYISANVFVDDGDDDPSNDKSAYKPYLISEQTLKSADGKEHKLKVGFIGFVPPQIMNWDKANLTGKVISKDIIEMAKQYVPKMKAEGADLVVAIPHSGLDVGDAKSMQENATYHLSKVDGIDAILFGHAHSLFPGGKAYNGFEAQGVDNVKGSINGIPAVMPGFWANHIGLIDLDLAYKGGKWTVADFKTELRSVKEVKSDEAVAASVAAEHEATNEWVSKPFAKIAAPVNSFFALAQDDPSIQIVSDAQMWYGEQLIKGTEFDGLPVLSAAAPFRAGRQGSADFTNVPAGDIAYRNVDLMFDGKAIDEKQSFLVVSNNYRASGGGNFPNVSGDTTAIKAPNENRQVVADYITEQAKANKDGFDPSADGNWGFKAINDTVVVNLRSSPLPEAAEFAKGLTQLKATGTTDADGFAIYQLDLSK